MTARTATTVVIGTLSGVACLFASFVVPVPIWVLFIAWASFSAAGGGLTGFAKSLTMNLVGAVCAVLALLAIIGLGGGVWALAVCVGLGSAILVAIGRFELLSFSPAGFLGFSCIVGTVAATGRGVDTPVIWGHPALLVMVAMILGAVFGLVSEKLTAALTTKENAAQDV